MATDKVDHRKIDKKSDKSLDNKMDKKMDKNSKKIKDKTSTSKSQASGKIKDKAPANKSQTSEKIKDKTPANMSQTSEKIKGMLKKPAVFQVFYDSLGEDDKDKLDKFTSKLKQHLALSKKENEQITNDFQEAILYYKEIGLSLDEALKRLNPSKLGGFYCHPPSLWYPLDYAAKIYPLSMRHGQMMVFRMSAYLMDEVIPQIMQMALNFTIKRFPSFATTVKKGVFWHYLDSSKRRFVLEAETDLPCEPLKISNNGSPAFRVIFYKERISVEFFHILTDGMGSITFLKTLLAEYLRLLGKEIPADKGVLFINDIIPGDELSNDFSKAEKLKKGGGFMGSPAVQMSGKLSKIRPCQILHFEINSDKLRELTRAKETTVTSYMLALMFIATKYASEESKGNIQIQVPVDMRKFHDSKTVRNFALYSNIRIPMSQITNNPDDILGEISKQLKEKSSQEAMKEMMSSTAKLVGSLRLVPLFIKNPVAKLVYGFLGDRIFSNTLSNIGVIDLPEEMAPYVDRFDFLIGPGSTAKATCTLGTYKNKAIFSIAKSTLDPSYEDKMNELLSNSGLINRIYGSEVYEF